MTPESIFMIVRPRYGVNFWAGRLCGIEISVVFQVPALGRKSHLEHRNHRNHNSLAERPS